MASGTVNVWGGGVTKGWIHDPLKNKFRLFFCKVLNRKLQNHIQTYFTISVQHLASLYIKSLEKENNDENRVKVMSC